MHSLRRLWIAVALIASTLLVSAVSFAVEPHSPCVTGVPLIYAGSPDVTTNNMIIRTCNDQSSCCSTRWGLSCVQNAARIARDVLGAGDVCGRYAWAQGPVPGTGQYFPRDFNLFVLSGEARSLRDSDGPVAASGNVALSFFNLNLSRREPVGLVSGGTVSLSSGTVFGSTFYRTWYSDGQVTYVDGVRPTAASNPFPIDFTAASTKLNAMSQAIKKYDAISATQYFGSLAFTGSDPELNVFWVPSTALTGATSYEFRVPSGSNVIVNVTGTNPSFANAGFTGSGLSANRTLWNFPDATSLSISSIGFVGSILAPKASATLRNGSVTGTIVVANAPVVDVELYAPFYRPPSATGAGVPEVDPTWSFTGAVTDDKTAANFSTEAGFLELAGGSYVAEGATRESPTHRIWYSFVPAVIQPKTKPLAVIFNGGPGSSTSSILFSFNTGPWTLDPTIAGAQKIVATNNAANWAQFANLLYIDAPSTGFSYPLANADGSRPSIGLDLDRDAGYFNRLVLRFLKRHPEILNNRVIIVGESYGGVRATWMFNHMYNYQAIGSPSNLYYDPLLYAEETDYFARVFGRTDPFASQIAALWGHQALISPVVAGSWQFHNYTSGTPDAFDASVCRAPNCNTLIPDPNGGGKIATCDVYNCDKEFDWSDKLEHTAAKNFVQISILSKAVGAPIQNIEWMKASSRTRAYGRDQGTIVPAPEMESKSAFGPLQIGDNYFVRFNDLVPEGYPGANSWPSDIQSWGSAFYFASHLHDGVQTFIAGSKYDQIVYTPEIPYTMKAIADILDPRAPLRNLILGGVSYDRNQNNGLVRPGLMQLFYNTSRTDARFAAMPIYAAGHSVPQRAPVELLTDVKQWYSNSRH